MDANAGGRPYRNRGVWGSSPTAHERDKRLSRTAYERVKRLFPYNLKGFTARPRQPASLEHARGGELPQVGKPLITLPWDVPSPSAAC